jgi:hypothetical protein
MEAGHTLIKAAIISTSPRIMRWMCRRGHAVQDLNLSLKTEGVD